MIKRFFLVFIVLLTAISIYGQTRVEIRHDKSYYDDTQYYLVNESKKLGPFDIMPGRRPENGFFYSMKNPADDADVEPVYQRDFNDSTAFNLDSLFKRESYNQWYCIDTMLNVKFTYPKGLGGVSPIKDGCSLVGKYCTFTGWGNEGAVDTCGNFIFNPIYDECWNCGNSIIGAGSTHYGKSRSNHLFFKRAYSNLDSLGLTFMHPVLDDYTTHTTIYNIASYRGMVGFQITETARDKRIFVMGLHYMMNFKFDKAKEMFSKISEEDEETYNAARYNIEQMEKGSDDAKRLEQNAIQ